MVWFAAHDQGHRFAGLQSSLNGLLSLVDLDPQAAAAPLNPERHAVPAFGKVWVDRYAGVTPRQPGKAKHREHPEPAESRDMNAAGGPHMCVRKINRRRLAQEAQRHLGIAQPGGNKAMHGGTQ